MSNAETVYEDRWGSVIDRPGEGYIEIRWFDSTADMSTDEFNEWLLEFSKVVQSRGRRAVLVDSTSFGMSPDKFDMAFRDANVIPNYNAAGVQRFAFHMPAGMPAIGSEPTNEAPGEFPTGYFGSREDAVVWLSG